jgi:hypothetical protein
MTKDEAIVRFELMSRRLTGQAWLFLVLVLVIDLLNQENVTGMRVSEKPKQFGPGELGAALLWHHWNVILDRGRHGLWA